MKGKITNYDDIKDRGHEFLAYRAAFSLKEIAEMFETTTENVVRGIWDELWRRARLCQLGNTTKKKMSTSPA